MPLTCGHCPDRASPPPLIVFRPAGGGLRIAPVAAGRPPRRGGGGGRWQGLPALQQLPGAVVPVAVFATFPPAMTGAAIAHNASYTQVFDRLPVAA